MRATLAALTALLLAGCTSGTLGPPSTTTAPAASSSSDTTIGQPLDYTSDDGTKATVTVLTVTPHPKGTGPLAQPPANGTYLVADILISVTAGTYNSNPLYWRWQDADATTVSFLDGNASTAGYGPQLSTGDLHAGQKTRGKVTFDAKAKAGGLIQLTDALGDVLAQWKT